MGKGSRDGYLSSKVPGPGTYESNDVAHFKGKVTFAKDQRLKNEKNANPGPG